jgi:hypothetical protein
MRSDPTMFKTFSPSAKLQLSVYLDLRKGLAG